MKAKPLIVYIEEDETPDNPQRSGLAYFLREHCGCEVVVYDNKCYFLENFERIRELNENGIVILIIVAQEYSDQHQQVIAKVRNELSSQLPIVVIPGGSHNDMFTGTPGDDRIFVYSHENSELSQLVKELVAGFNPKLTDHSFTLASQDRKLPRGLFPVSSSIYEQQMERIKLMNDEERTEFSRRLNSAIGRELINGGVYVRRVSFGKNIYGFAIDPVTLEYLFTVKYGSHSIADTILSVRIDFIESLKNNDFLIKNTISRYEQRMSESGQRLMFGLVVPSLDGFIVSFLILSRLPLTGKDRPGHVKRITDFLKEQRVLLLVTTGGTLVEA